MSELKLYSSIGCPFARRVRITLAEKGLDFELHEIDLHNRPADFDEISPYGKVPVLIHQGGRVYESAIINEYIDEQFADPPLLPRDAMQKAQARIWMDYCDTRFSAASWKFVQASGDTDKQAAARAALQDCCLFIEREGMRKLSDGPYWLGENISLVDIQYMPFFQRYVSGALAAELPAECARLRDWLHRISTRDSFLQTSAVAARSSE